MTAMSCPACGGRATRMQRAAPGDRPGAVAVYPCNDWITPAAAEKVRAAYQQQIEQRGNGA